jgi:hypothetical protein
VNATADQAAGQAILASELDVVSEGASRHGAQPVGAAFVGEATRRSDRGATRLV